jgi:CxxC motif-containing protein
MTLRGSGDDLHVSGNQCKRGVDYAIEEYRNPTRMLTTTMKLVHLRHKRLPVHSSAPLPKALLFDAMDVINERSVKAPVHTGQVLIPNILDTGVDICASRDMEEK